MKPGFYVAHSDLKQTWEALGLAAEAEATSRQLLEMMPNYLLQNPDDSRARMFFGITLLETGDRERAITAGVTNYAWMKHDPDFDPIRNDPEFIELMQGH